VVEPSLIVVTIVGVLVVTVGVVQAAYAPHKPVVEGQPNATTFDLILKLSL
jgi:hypothetical protein